MTTTINIEQWKREGREQGAKWMLVVWDEFPFPPEPYPVFVVPGENITERFAALDRASMQNVTGVYLLSE